MGLPAPSSSCSTEDYLAWESTQLDRHEYLNGEVSAMAVSLASVALTLSAELLFADVLGT